MKIIKIFVISLILIFLVLAVAFNISGLDSKEHSYNYSWTKAICNESHCQDYVIECEGQKAVSFTPITGAVISIPKNWEDPRNETMRKRICEFN